MRHGVHAMELLVNGLLARGARRDRLEAKLFGGARMVTGLTDVGRQNALFAERFLQRESIPVVNSSLGGDQARRIQFWPVSGRVRHLFVEKQANAVFEAERRRPAPVAPVNDGAVELF
jgi:chemotaxis protein CheD